MALDKMKLEFSTAITDLTETNSSFDHGNLRIAYTGKNRNGSFISKASFEHSAPTMYGCPVVANYIREIDEIGSHDGEFVEKPDGEVQYVNITQPVGFVPPGAKYWWENVEDDGVIHQYLNTEVILWKRQEAYEKIIENGITKHSMEITVKDGEMKDDYYQINDFEFTAFCLLGTAEPCFESSALFTFSVGDVQAELDEMFAEFKLAFAGDLAEKEVNPTMDKLQELLEKFALTVEDIDFEYENLSDEELEAAFEEHFGEIKDEPEVADPEPEVFEEPEEEPEPVPTQDFALNSQICEALSTAVRGAEKIVDEEYGWEFSRYFMVDFDAATQEVYFEDMSDNWHLFGATYSFDGDNVVVDFEAKKRKKYAIVDYDEGEQASPVGNSFELAVEQCKKYCKQVKEDMDVLLSTQKKQQAEELFARFDGQLEDVAEYKILKASIDKYTIEELEEKLFALVGRQQFTVIEPKEKAAKAPVFPHAEEPDDAPYGSLFNFLKK